MSGRFQSEKPAENDAFPGKSHQKIADAIAEIIDTNDEIKVIGLDGDFGSGKSSIINMFSKKIRERDSHYKVWTFDCEQNFQGSIKNNFLELFAQEALEQAQNSRLKKEKISEIRDIALGKRYDYTKTTKSKISSWAIIFFISILFSANAIRELIKIITTPEAQGNFITTALISALAVSPILVLIAAKIWLFFRKEEWNLWGLIKGNSTDEIKERIDISREVGIVEWKSSLGKMLENLENCHYIIIIDNLDRLPKDSLRSVWSDLEIFTSAANESSFKIIVPFCSEKVALYLAELAPGDSEDNRYYAKDFISKKFPIVFRSPPVITSGWKSFFIDLWLQSFGNEERNEASLCAILVHRHAPNSNKTITPRFQKRFFNDIQTTLLTAENNPNRLIVAAYILICRYNNVSIQEFLSKNSPLTDSKDDAHPPSNLINEINLTKGLLDTYFGNDLETGWPAAVLQLHYQTTFSIALSELIESPVESAISAGDGKKLSQLTETFGFNDALRKILISETHNIELVTKALAETVSTLSSPEKKTDLIGILNNHYSKHKVVSNAANEDELYFNGLRKLKESGLKIEIFDDLLSDLHGEVQTHIDVLIAAAEENHAKDFIRYDNYLFALEKEADPILAYKGEYYISRIIPDTTFKVLAAKDFRFNDKGFADAVRQIISNERVTFDKTPIEPDTLPQSIFHLFRETRFGGETPHKKETFLLSKPETDQIIAAIQQGYTTPGLMLGLLFSQQLDPKFLASLPATINSADDNLAKVAGLITLIKFNSTKSISNINNADELLKADFETSYSLVKATCTHAQIIELIITNDIQSGADILLRAIKNRDIAIVSVRKTFENYDKIAQSMKIVGVNERKLLEIFEIYNHLFKDAVFPIKGLPESFITAAFTPNIDSSIGNLLLGHFTDEEISKDEWKSYISEEGNNFELIQAQLLSSQSTPNKSAPLRDAIIESLKEISLLSQDHELAFSRSLQSSKLLSDRVKSNFSVDLRRLVLADTPAEFKEKIIESFGEYISLFNIENIVEYEELSKLIEISLNNPDAQSLRLFLDLHAESICSFRIPKEYLLALAIQHNDLNIATPKLYSELHKDRLFRSEVKRIQREERAKQKDNHPPKDEAPVENSDIDEEPKV